jgi:uncharacterized protein YyaL (SSP411 family)
MNRLAHEQSAYLRHAAHQKIDWYPWSDEAFDKARREEKPLFLSSGAIWCHWCHVMAAESFEQEEIAMLMNELFVNIKLDRDERPDIDRRYQEAVAAMGGGNGWPLSVFLTPEKEPFFGGTYFPPEDRQGRPGFKNVLRAVSNFYRTKRDDAAAYASKVLSILQPEPLHPEDLSEGMLDEAEKTMLSLFDPQNGGFGIAPKFPMAGALEFLLRRCASGRHQSAGQAVRATLDAMAQGGFHDQLGGGFHRYSVDEAWIVPHFEKMADDNAGLLKNYVDGYALLDEERYRVVAERIIAFSRDVLEDRSGGFYASQDADVTPDDEGGYFTWTAEECKKVLSPEEYEALSLHLFHPRGLMHHDPAKTVLAVSLEPEAIAKKLGKSSDAVMELISRAKAKLLTARKERTAPFVDETLYTSLNGMLIVAYLRVFMTLGNSPAKEFALKSLDRILRERISNGILYRTAGVVAVLDDYIHLIDALVSAYEATADRQYLDRAEGLMAVCREKFFDADEGGFFDTSEEVLGRRLKRIEDVPHPSANAVAIMLLLKLAFITGKDQYRREAEQSLRIFAGPARDMGIHVGAYFCALDAYFHTVTLTVEAAPGGELARAARFFAGKSYSPIVYGQDNGRVTPCFRDACYAPVYDTNSMTELFKKRMHP